MFDDNGQTCTFSNVFAPLYTDPDTGELVDGCTEDDDNFITCDFPFASGDDDDEASLSQFVCFGKTHLFVTVC